MAKRDRAVLAKYARDYRQRHPERARAYGKLIALRRRDSNRALINSIKNRPCMDCGGLFPPYVMDFDHRDPTQKLAPIGSMSGKAVAQARILAEVAKCDLVCANCHRIRTYGRGQEKSA